MWDPFSNFEEAILPNGLTVYAAHLPDRPWQHVDFLIYSGADQDPEGFEGTAHFLEHLVSDNGMLPQKETELFFDGHGGVAKLGATTFFDSEYGFFAPTDMSVIKKAFSLFGHMLLSATIEKRIEHERQIITEEIRSTPISDLDRRIHVALRSGTMLERFTDSHVMGDSESIKRITQKDLQEYYDAHYTPANMSIVGVGGMHLSKIVDILSESVFAEDKQGVRTNPQEMLLTIPNPTKSRICDFDYEYEDNHFRRRYCIFVKVPGIFGWHIRFVMKRMLHEIFFERMRNQTPWAYSVDIDITDRQCFNEFLIRFPFPPNVNESDVNTVAESCLTSVEGCEDLFERIKHECVAEARMIDLDGSSICSLATGNLSKYRKIYSLADDIAMYECLTMKDVTEIMKWFASEKRLTVIR